MQQALMLLDTALLQYNFKTPTEAVNFVTGNMDKKLDPEEVAYLLSIATEQFRQEVPMKMFRTI